MIRIAGRLALLVADMLRMDHVRLCVRHAPDLCADDSECSLAVTTASAVRAIEAGEQSPDSYFIDLQVPALLECERIAREIINA